MIAFGHTAIGAAVGIAAYQLIGPNVPPLEGVLLSGVAGTVSHYVLDAVPHGHFFVGGDFRKQIKPVLIFDLGLGVCLFVVWSLASVRTSLVFLFILFGIGGAQLPDVIDGLMATGWLPRRGLLKTEHAFHQATHWHGGGENGLLWGKRDVWQVLVVILSLVLIMKVGLGGLS